ncbi:Smr/MutS family protein [Moraxella cuniculi]|uniref:Probable DNA endonuclease SmrA n=1 Tax=Moraxella cuniculi TaxID=34061 RepID=A0A3S4UV04_9GAMM|nr:Smr/MutS family protein [Moraxella cuniculi]VEG13631.1 Probable DNA endonuclease SmrA [Moraxella cuniculi]
MSTPSFKDILSKSQQQALAKLSKPEPTVTAQKAPVAADRPTSHDDKQLFLQAMHGVVPLKNTPTVSQKKPTAIDDNALRRRMAAQGDEQIGGTLSDMQALLNPVAGEAYLSYKNPTLQNKVFEQLKQGKLRWYDAVDLHGSSIEEARSAVQLLIHQSINQGETVVKIVHGKGKDAIIKTCVNGWLRQMNEVMAFVSAPANDGGNGAVLVLLKKKKLGD